jgi:hypothetical protein
MLHKSIFDKWRITGKYLDGLTFQKQILTIDSIYKMLHEELFCYATNDDLIFESMDLIVNNFYKSDKERKELLYLVQNKWCAVADFVVPWYLTDALRKDSSPIINKGGIHRQPFISLEAEDLRRC